MRPGAPDKKKHDGEDQHGCDQLDDIKRAALELSDEDMVRHATRRLGLTDAFGDRPTDAEDDAEWEEARDEFLTETNANGVMTRPVWNLMNRLEMYKDCQVTDLSNAEWIEARLVNIPSSVRIN